MGAEVRFRGVEIAQWRAIARRLGVPIETAMALSGSELLAAMRGALEQASREVAGTPSRPVIRSRQSERDASK